MDHAPNPATRNAVIAQYPFALGDRMFVLLGILADAAIILSASVFSSAVYHRVIYGEPGVLRNYLASGLLVATIYIPIRIARGKYPVSSYLTEGRNVGSMFYAWNYAFLTVLLIGFVTKETALFSRAAIILFYLGGFGALMAGREAFFRLARGGFRKGLLLGAPTMLLGAAETLRAFHRRYRPADYGLRVVDEIVLEPPAEDGAPPPELAEKLKRAAARASALRVEEIFILYPWRRLAMIEKTLETFLDMPVSVHLGPDRILENFHDARIRRTGALTSLELIRPPLSAWARGAKRALDILGAGAGLLLLSPLLALTALAIRLDSPGPALFIQTRRGFNNRPFRIYKFRTMRVMEDAGPLRQARRGDPRVTRVGRILRRFSIDELPQLLNVLKGEMSLVGPRPHALDHDDAFESRVRLYARRRRVLPGITGWAQVNGYRGETDTPEKIARRVEYDLEYIDRWSVWFDLYIIMLTLFSPRAWRNAY